MNIEYKQFPNPSYAIVDVPSHLLSVIDAEINEIVKTNFNESENYNNRLAGNIEHQYKLNKCQREVFVFAQEVARNYVNHNNKFYIFQETGGGLNHNFRMSDLWVNFQKKHEFNPLHHHSEHLSFVIWRKIPFRLEDEMASKSVNKSAAPLASTFQFYYNTVISGIETEIIYTDKQSEGKMIMFPSQIKHCVNPFYTSDEFRISVAGNLLL